MIMFSTKIAAVLFFMAPHVVVGISPKMIAKPVEEGKPLDPLKEGSGNTIHTRMATFVGHCSPGQPFGFPLGGESGRAVIGVTSSDVGAAISLDPEEEGTISVSNEAVPNFFGMAGNLDGFVGIPIDFKGVPSTGTKVSVSCRNESPVIAAVRDDSGLELRAMIIDEEDGEFLQLLDEETSEADLKGEVPPPRPGQLASPVSFDLASPRRIKIKHRQGRERGLALIHAKTKDNKGNFVDRTFMKSSESKQKHRSIPAKCCKINEEDDIIIEFSGLAGPLQSLKVDARLGLQIEELGTIKDLVDVSAMLTADAKELILHGGWVRRALQEYGLEGSENGWDIVLLDAVVTDPENGYSIVGQLGNVISKKLPPGQAKKRLAAAPSSDEIAISDEMRSGRKPPHIGGERNLRQLSGNHKKILVHGYCAPNPWPTGDFTNAIAFDHWDSGTNNWTHDYFARNIDSFANENNIHGCSCIAHSQGGAACLHLYTYYWSCLDYAIGGERMIQSMGTPYQGTYVAGALALLAQIFAGEGCGWNSDLTEGGATSWLSYIPSWARSKVYYYTTSFEDNWWSYDYCHVGTDMFLDDPDDGVVEKGRAYLDGGNYKQHLEGWCHTTGMSDPAQYHNHGKNQFMDSKARL